MTRKDMGLHWMLSCLAVWAVLVAGGTARADMLIGLSDIVVVNDAIDSLTYDGTTYVVADEDLMLGETTRWYVDPGSGQETLWEEGGPTAPTTVPGTSNPKDGDVGSKADNFMFRDNGATNISSIDAIDFQETVFPTLADTFFVFERNGNDTGTFQAILSDGSLGPEVAFSPGSAYANTGINVNGQNAFGAVFTTDSPVLGVRITAGGHDTLSISIPAPVLPTFVWDGDGNGQWGDTDAVPPYNSRWEDLDGNPLTTLPTADTNAVINANVVTVAEDREVLNLEVNGGGITIADGRTLTVSKALFGTDTTLNLGAGAALTAGSGSLDTVTAAGDAVIGVAFDTMPVTTLNVPVGTFTKRGDGTLVPATINASSGTVLRIEGGSLDLAGEDPLGGAKTVELAGERLSLAAPMIGYEPGLVFGAVAGDANEVDYPEVTTVTVDLHQTEDPIPADTTHVFYGQIYDQDEDGWMSFQQNVDDVGDLWIDDIREYLYIGSPVGLDQPFPPNEDLEPGWHTFELRLGGPGEPPTGLLGFAYDPEGWADFVHPEDPGDGSLFRTPAYGPIDLADVTLVVSGPSELALDTSETSNVGPLQMNEGGRLTVSGAAGGVVFAEGAAIDSTAGSVGFDTRVTTTLTGETVGLAGNSAPATITKTGTADLILDRAGTGLDAAKFDVQQGRLIGVGGPNPFGGAGLQLSGGDLLLASGAAETDVVYDNAVTVTAAGTLTAGRDSVGQSGPLTVTVGGPGKDLVVNSRLTLQTTDGYRLEVAGDVSGSGGIRVEEADVTLAGNVDVGSVDLYGGVLKMNAGATVDTARIDDGTLDTGTGQLVVNRALTLGNTGLTIENGTFTVEGSDLLAEADFTLSGGLLTVDGGGGSASILFLVEPDPAGGGLQPGDDAVMTRLTNFHKHNVTILGVPDGETLPGLPDEVVGMDLVMISSTILSGDVNTLFTDQNAEFRDMAIPTIQWEAALNDEFLLSNAGGNLGNLNLDPPVPLQDTITITLDGANHPLGAGLPEGDVLVRNSPTTFHTQSNGNLALDAVVIANASNGNPAILVVDEAGLLNDGVTTASANRISLFLGDEGVDDMTQDGLDLFDAAIEYMLGAAGGPIVLPNANLLVTSPSTVNLTAMFQAELGNLTVNDGVTLDLLGSAVASFQDVSGGNGATINGDVEVRGVLAAGDELATLEVGGNLFMQRDSTYVADIRGDSSDTLVVGGKFDLDEEDGRTTLEIRIQGGQDDMFKAGDHVLVTAEDIAGEFFHVDGLGEYLTKDDLSYDGGTLTANIALNLNAGDANLDTKTDVRDFNVWNANKFTVGTEWVSGDFNGDGTTDVRDFNLWNAAKFTAASGPGQLVEGQVPEPGTLLLLACGALVPLIAWRRRRTT